MALLQRRRQIDDMEHHARTGGGLKELSSEELLAEDEEPMGGWLHIACRNHGKSPGMKERARSPSGDPDGQVDGRGLALNPFLTSQVPVQQRAALTERQ